MKKILLLLLVTISTILWSCHSQCNLSNSVWYNVSPITLSTQEYNMVTSLYFWDDKVMNINTALIQDSIVVLPATMAANGTYTIKGSLKKANIQIQVTNMQNVEETYQGVITSKGMILISPDSIAKPYNKIANVSLK